MTTALSLYPTRFLEAAIEEARRDKQLRSCSTLLDKLSPSTEQLVTDDGWVVSVDLGAGDRHGSPTFDRLLMLNDGDGVKSVLLRIVVCCALVSVVDDVFSGFLVKATRRRICVK